MFLILKASIPEYSVNYDLVNSSCTLVLQQLSIPDVQLGVFFGNTVLRQLHMAIHEATASFARKRRYHLTPSADDSSELQIGSPMQWTLSFGRVRATLQPALRMSSGTLLVLCRSQTRDGDNVIKRFEPIAESRLASLPNKGRWMICAMKHTSNLTHRIDILPVLFESIAMEEFERQGWVGELDDAKLSAINFVTVWQQCWKRILSWRPISSLASGTPGDNLFDLFSERDKHLDCARRYVSLSDEQELLGDLQPVIIATEPPTEVHLPTSPRIYVRVQWL